MIVNKFKDNGKSWTYVEYKDMEYKLYTDDRSEEYIATKQFDNDLILKINYNDNISKTIIPNAWTRFIEDYTCIDFKSYIRYWFQTSIYNGYESLNPVTLKIDKFMSNNTITEAEQFKNSIKKDISDEYIKDDILEVRDPSKKYYDKIFSVNGKKHEIIDLTEIESEPHCVMFVYSKNGNMKKCIWFDEDSIDVYNRYFNDNVRFTNFIKNFKNNDSTLIKCKKYIALSLIGRNY